MKKLLAVLVTLGVLGVVLAGCGAKDDAAAADAGKAPAKAADKAADAK